MARRWVVKCEPWRACLANLDIKHSADDAHLGTKHKLDDRCTAKKHETIATYGAVQ